VQELKKRASDLDYKVTELDNASREAKRLKLQNEAEKKRADAAIAGETKANLAREEAEKAKAALELEKQQAEAARKEQAERARSARLGDLDLATWKLDKILGRVNFSCQHFSSFKPGCERVLQVRGPGTAPQKPRGRLSGQGHARGHGRAVCRPARPRRQAATAAYISSYLLSERSSCMRNWALRSDSGWTPKYCGFPCCWAEPQTHLQLLTLAQELRFPPLYPRPPHCSALLLLAASSSTPAGRHRHTRHN
jgi:hypothetical protein